MGEDLNPARDKAFLPDFLNNEDLLDTRTQWRWGSRTAPGLDRSACSAWMASLTVAVWRTHELLKNGLIKCKNLLRKFIFREFLSFSKISNCF